MRETATAAIAATRFVPEKGRNRLNSMVEGRPDWVISRQRAWGVPITLFVDRKTGQYLNDSAVNARIVAAVKAQGVDAWNEESAQALLGNMLFFGEGGMRQRARGLMWLTMARDAAIPDRDSWVRDLYEKAFSEAADTDRQAAIAYLEQQMRKRQ